MPRRLASLLLAALSPALALAAEAPVDIDKIKGVYRRAFRNGDISGAKFTSTDVLEILGLEKGRAYFRTELNFFNGHICSLSGIAEVEKAALVYRDDSGGPDHACVLRLVPSGGRIRFEDVGGLCAKESCGARGWYNQSSFKTAARRKIAEPARLKASAEYKEAVEAYEARRQKAKP